MEGHNKTHEEILKWFAKEFKSIFEDSDQAIYIYVCDRHKLCNKNFSSLLGYNSPEEWEMKEEVLSDVKEDDQNMIVSAYGNAVEKKRASSINISWKNRKIKGFVKTNVILVPLTYKGEPFALHFVRKI